MIDKNVPLPAGIRNASNNDKKHYAKHLKINESYFVACSEASVKLALNTARKTGGSYTRRKVTENGVDGYRVWRTA